MLLLCSYFATNFRTVFSKMQSVIFQILHAQTLIKMSAVLQKIFRKLIQVLINISFTLTLQYN